VSFDCLISILAIPKSLTILDVSTTIVLANATPNNFNPIGIATTAPIVKTIIIIAIKISEYCTILANHPNGADIKSNNRNLCLPSLDNTGYMCIGISTIITN
jgi:hypothetical protein